MKNLTFSEMDYSKDQVIQLTSLFFFAKVLKWPTVAPFLGNSNGNEWWQCRTIAAVL